MSLGEDGVFEVKATAGDTHLGGEARWIHATEEWRGTTSERNMMGAESQ